MKYLCIFFWSLFETYSTQLETQLTEVLPTDSENREDKNQIAFECIPITKGIKDEFWINHICMFYIQWLIMKKSIDLVLK